MKKGFFIKIYAFSHSFCLTRRLFFDIISMYIYVRKAARKTRTVFSGVVGNEALKTKIFSDVVSDSLSHAYIIEGKKGSGKHTIAKMTAAALSCESKDSSTRPLPCGECLNCRKILGNNSADVITVGREEGKASIGVETARFLRSDVYVVPNDLDYKVYIIEEADIMTPQAQNALLLTLEEPPSFVKFFLLCEDAGAMLETIRSRAQILRTEPIREDKMDEYLTSTSHEARSLKASDPTLYGELLMTSQGSIGAALELLDEKKLKHSSENRTIARDFVNAVANGCDSESAALLASRFSTKRESLTEELELILLALRDLIFLSKSENAPLVFFHDRETALILADSTSAKRLMSVYENVSKALDAIAFNANVRLSIIKLFSDTSLL